MSERDGDLLQPSLSQRSISAAPYSQQTMFLSCFFGGPLAGVALMAVNAARLRRLAKDALIIIVLALVSIGVEVLLIQHRGEVEAELKQTLGLGSFRLAIEACGLAVFGVAYWLHREEQRSAELQGLDRPNGWIGGIACVLAGVALQTLLAFVIIANEGR